MKLNLNFERSGGLEKNPFRGGGMDIQGNQNESFPRTQNQARMAMQKPSCKNTPQYLNELLFADWAE